MSRVSSSPQTIRHVFLTSAAYGHIVSIVARRGLNETGGPLVGYMSVDHALVITAAGDPGPRGVCRPDRVMIDGRHATAFCAAETARAHGAVRYVGDWHVHNGVDATPSPTDLRALRTLPECNDWGYPTISLILCATLDEYACICRIGRKLGALECSVLDE